MPTLLTQAQIARYAQIRRPTVSNWRRRHADFPAPIGGSGGQPRFDAAEVAAWLDGRSLPADVKLHEPYASTYGDIFRRGLDGAADSHDHSAGDLLREGLKLLAARTTSDRIVRDETSAPHVERIVVELLSEHGPGGAAEQIFSLAARQGWQDARADMPDEVCDLIVDLVPHLYGAWNGLSVADLNAGNGRLAARIAEAGAREIAVAEADPERAALTRLRLICHGVDPLPVDGHTDVVIANPPFQSGENATSSENPLQSALAAIDRITDHGYALAVVPAWTLDRDSDLPVSKARDALVRGGHLKAVIQLPHRTYPHLPGSDFALLVMQRSEGAARSPVTICDAEKIRQRFGRGWTAETARIMTGPRSKRTKSPCVDFDIASLRGAPSLLAAHLLAPAESADVRITRVRQSRGIAARALQHDPTDALELLGGISLRPSSAEARHTTIGVLLRAGQLVHLAGHRIPAAAIGSAGQRVIGKEELLGELPLGRRRVDLMALASHNAATLTEPGDVVLLAGDRLRIFIDEDGGSVLQFPAQGLRVPGHRRHTSTFRDEPQKPWIGPYALAALLRAARNSTRTSGSVVRRSGLRHMELPHLADQDREAFDDLLYKLHETTQRARDQVTALEELQARIADGVADGAFTVEAPAQNPRRGR